MAIKGVSDIRRLPRLGKIRLGEKALAQSGKEYPKAVDYFVCPSEVQKVYGGKPRVLDIMLPVDDSGIFFPQWYKRYGQSTGLICKGDGEVATFIDTETGEMIEMDCVPDECEWYAKKHCRRLANLQFLLPKVPGLGVWQIDTTSFYSIININSAIEMIRAVAGRVHMLPLQLILKPQEVSPDGRKKTVYVLDLMAPVTLSKLIANTQKTPMQLLMPAMDENERPEDLYPDGVLDQQDPDRFTIESQEQPISRTQQQGKNNDMQKKSDTVSGDEHIPSRVVNVGIQPEQDPIDAELHSAWDVLNISKAKRTAILNKPGLDKKKLLDDLSKAVDMKLAHDEKGGNSEESATPPPPPMTKPYTQPGMFF